MCPTSCSNMCVSVPFRSVHVPFRARALEKHNKQKRQRTNERTIVRNPARCQHSITGIMYTHIHRQQPHNNIAHTHRTTQQRNQRTVDGKMRCTCSILYTHSNSIHISAVATTTTFAGSKSSSSVWEHFSLRAQSLRLQRPHSNHHRHQPTTITSQQAP